MQCAGLWLCFGEEYCICCAVSITYLGTHQTERAVCRSMALFGEEYCSCCPVSITYLGTDELERGVCRSMAMFWGRILQLLSGVDHLFRYGRIGTCSVPVYGSVLGKNTAVAIRCRSHIGTWSELVYVSVFQNSCSSQCKLSNDKPLFLVHLPLIKGVFHKRIIN